MTNLAYETETTFSPMDRPHYTRPSELTDMAVSFVEFNAVDPQTRRNLPPQFFVHDFVAAARQLGYEDIEHYEAIAILEEETGRVIDEYRRALQAEADDIFNSDWLLQVPFDSVEEFIELYSKPTTNHDAQEYVMERFDDLMSMRSDDRYRQVVDRIYEDVALNYIPTRIHTIIQEYQKDPDAFRKSRLPGKVHITAESPLPQGEKL